MTQEEKQLLLKDLCARLPYGVIVKECDGVKENDNKLLDIDMFDGCINYDYIIDDIKPYLRPMSSMTEEEESMYNLLQGISHLEQHWTADDGKFCRYADAMDYLLEHHFDFRGLIPMGLALEAPRDMYKTE